MVKAAEIITNWHRRDVLRWWDLDESDQEWVRSEWDDNPRLMYDAEWVKFKGQLWDLAEFTEVGGFVSRESAAVFPGWDGYLQCYGFLGGLVFKWDVEDWGGINEDLVIIGTYG